MAFKTNLWSGLAWPDNGQITPAMIPSGIASGASFLIPDALSNHTYRHRFVIAGFGFSFSTAPTLGALELYFLYCDQYTGGGTAFTDGSASIDPPVPPVLTIPPRLITGQQYVIVPGIPIFPAPFKVLLKNRTDKTVFGSPNSLLRLQTYNLELD